MEQKKDDPINGIKKSILIVARDEELISEIKEVLKGSVYFYTSVNTGLQAIKEYRHQDFDYLMMHEDLELMDVDRTLKYLETELNKNPYVIILSSSGKLQPEQTESRKEIFYLKQPLSNLLERLENTSAKITTSSQKPYSLNYLEEISDNNTSFIIESLNLFNQSVNEDLKDLEAHVKLRHYDEVRNVAHKLKPSFAVVENNIAVALCDKINHSKNEEEICMYISALKNEYQKIITSLHEDFPDLNFE